MRLALVALVLVVGAAVVLWFGNTLNSWVLGGLIGGFAALLISIPISVTLFFHLSQRYEGRGRTRDEETIALAQAHEYGYQYEEEEVEVYEADSYLLPEEEAWYEEENNPRYRAPAEQYLPVPSQSRLSAQPPAVQPPVARRRQGTGQVGSGKLPATHRPSSSGPEYFPGFHGYQGRSFRSQQQTAALRAALDEASQRNERTGMVRGASTRKFSAVRPTASFEQEGYEEQPPTRNLPRQSSRQYRPRPVIDSTSGLSSTLADSAARRSLPAAGESTASRFTQRPPTRNYDELETENVRRRSPQQQTGPMYQQTGQLRQQQTGQTRQTGQTGQLRQQQYQQYQQQTGKTGQLRPPQTGRVGRNPNLEGQRRNPDVVTGSLRNPMVRRAPYMYEDDALREELSQMIDPPTVRRSSRYAAQQYEEYEQE
jgi:hypothetical protein